MDKTECVECETRIRGEERDKILKLMIPCYGGNKLILARDLKIIKNNKEENDGFGRNKK